MTETDTDFETRLTRVLQEGAEHLKLGDVPAAFDPNRPRSLHRRHRRRNLSRKVAVLSATVGLVVAGSAAAAVVEHVNSAPVTETDQARCYSTDSLAGGTNFAGLTTTAAGLPGSRTQVIDALAACRLSWQDGFLTLGSTEVGGTRQPTGPLNSNHPVPPLVVCVLPGGTAAVFPDHTGGTCQQLGLPAAQQHS